MIQKLSVSQTFPAAPQSAIQMECEHIKNEQAGWGADSYFHCGSSFSGAHVALTVAINDTDTEGSNNTFTMTAGAANNEVIVLSGNDDDAVSPATVARILIGEQRTTTEL